MRSRDAIKVRLLWQRGPTFVLLVLLGVAALATDAFGASSTQVTVKRCGYTTATYGRSAVYPWKLSCDAARAVIAGSDNPNASMINFGAGWDGAAIRIDGKYWVCTGQMGYYNCGYPYRPATLDGQKGYKGPFTKDVEYQTCAHDQSPCTATFEFTQPTG